MKLCNSVDLPQIVCARGSYGTQCNYLSQYAAQPGHPEEGRPRISGKVALKLLHSTAETYVYANALLSRCRVVDTTITCHIVR